MDARSAGRGSVGSARNSGAGGGVLADRLLSGQESHTAGIDGRRRPATSEASAGGGGCDVLREPKQRRLHPRDVAGGSESGMAGAPSRGAPANAPAFAGATRHSGALSFEGPFAGPGALRPGASAPRGAAEQLIRRAMIEGPSRALLLDLVATHAVLPTADVARAFSQTLVAGGMADVVVVRARLL